MKTKEEHKPGESFVQSMKLVAMAVIQWPIITKEVREIIHHAKELLIEAVVAPLFRLLVLLLFPITVPFFALLIRREVARNEAWRQKIRAAGIHQMGGAQ